jgi:lambda family phage portal protein
MDDSQATEFLRRLGESHRQAPSAPPRASRQMINFFAQRFDSSNWAGGQGGFAGGRVDRLSENWTPLALGPNRKHAVSAARMRARARQLADDHPHAQAAIEEYIANVVGLGIGPKPTFPEPELRKSWTAEYNIWGGLTAVGGPECDSTGIDTIAALQALWLREIIVAGGCLLHFVDIPDRSRRLPLALELIKEDCFADDRDQWGTFGQNPKTTTIIRGVEVDPARGRPLAYWVRRTDPQDLQADLGDPIRIPADRCHYGYFRREIGQYRGISLLHASLVWLHRIGDYFDSELVASQMKSKWAYQLTSDDADSWGDSLLTDEDALLGVDAHGNAIEHVQAGMVFRGRPKDKINAIGPNIPGGDCLPWIQLIEQSISIGMGLSRFAVTRDGASANFSSLRSVQNADRVRYRRMQHFAIQQFSHPTWREFVTAAVRAFRPGFPRPAVFLADREGWLAVAHRTPGFASANPLDDARSADLNLRNHIDTRERLIAAATGGDWEDTFDQLDREDQGLRDRGLLVDPVEETAPADQPADQPDDAGGAQ